MNDLIPDCLYEEDEEELKFMNEYEEMLSCLPGHSVSTWNNFVFMTNLLMGV